MIVQIIQAELRIHDLSNNPLAVIPIGDARVQQGFVRILHSINIIEIKKLIDEIRFQLNNGSFCTPMHNLLVIKQQILYDTYSKLTPITNTQPQNVRDNGHKNTRDNADGTLSALSSSGSPEHQTPMISE